MSKNSGVPYKQLKDETTGRRYWDIRDIHLQNLLRAKDELQLVEAKLGADRARLIEEMKNYFEKEGKTSTDIAQKMADITKAQRALRPRLRRVNDLIAAQRRQGKPTLVLKDRPFLEALLPLHRHLKKKQAAAPQHTGEQSA